MKPVGTWETQRPGKNTLSRPGASDTLKSGSRIISWAIHEMAKILPRGKFRAVISQRAEQQYEYAFDNIGHRTSAKMLGDATPVGFRSALQGAKLLNQYIYPVRCRTGKAREPITACRITMMPIDVMSNMLSHGANRTVPDTLDMIGMTSIGIIVIL